MPLSIRQALAQTLESGSAVGAELAWDEVTRYLRSNYIHNDAEKARIAMHKRRADLYSDNPVSYLHGLIDKVFTDPDVKAFRKNFAETASFSNPLKRIVNEISTVYTQAAQRTVGNEADNETYRKLQKLCKQDSFSRRFNRQLNLHRTLLVRYRVQNLGTVAEPELAPKLDIITPERCHLIAHPADPSRLIGVIVRIRTAYARTSKASPCFEVWTPAEKFFLDSEGRILGKPVQHGFPRIPFVYVSIDETGDSLWPGKVGEDLVNAHLTVLFAGVLLLKEMKSGTGLPVIQGDGASLARGQAADSETPFEVPDGVTVNHLDMTMDLQAYIGVSNHALETCANAYGMSAGLLKHQGVQSAEARDLMRVPLRELRIEQQSPIRDFERELAEVQSMVNAQDWPVMAFSTDGWSIDFADPQTPRSVKEQLEEFEHARRLSLDSTIRFILRQNPDLTEEDAERVILSFIKDELWRNEALRPLSSQSGSPRAELPEAVTTAATVEESDDGSVTVDSRAANA